MKACACHGRAKKPGTPKGSVAECGRLPVQSVRRSLRRLMAYGSTNKYRPVKNCKASGITADRPSELVYFFSAIATMLMSTATVKAMDSQRCVSRIHLFQFNRTSF